MRLGPEELVRKRAVYLRRIVGYLITVLCVLSLNQSGAAIPTSGSERAVQDAAMKLIRFCEDPAIGFDEHAVSILADHVLSAKPDRQSALPKVMGCTGAYYEFDTKTNLARLAGYSYNHLIPQVVTKPSSLRYSIWKGIDGETQRLPSNWEGLSRRGTRVIIHGIQYDSNTPDLSTGVYHEQDLKRTIIFLNHGGRHVMVSISKQVGISKVGKKGAILGNDTDWNYYYSGQAGATITGFGWAKSYIYDYFSVAVFAESSNSPNLVKTGVFQWLRAGWSGLNFVKESHIIDGMKRFGRDFKTILESPRLPPIRDITSVYQELSNMAEGDIAREYLALREAQESLALQTGKINRGDKDRKISLAGISKNQMVEELMLERLKSTLGKQTLLEK